MSNETSNVNLSTAERQDMPTTTSASLAVDSTSVGITAGTVAEESGSLSRVRFSQKFPKVAPNDIMQNWTEVNSISFQTTDTSGTALITFDPWVAYLANAAIAAKIKNFAMISGTLELLLVTTAPAGGMGAYLITAVPNGGTTAAATSSVGTTVYYEAAMSTDINAIIDLSASSNVHFKLPFIWPKDKALLPAGPVNMYSVLIFCMQPIGNGFSTSTVTGRAQLYCRMAEDYEFSVLSYQAKANYNLSSHKDKINDKVKSVTGGHKASEVAGGIASVAASVTSVAPFLAPFTEPIAAVASGISSVLDWFGFTRETAEKPPMPVMKRPWSNVANLDNDDTSEIAALSVSNTISIDPLINGGVDNMDPCSFAHIFPRWVLVKQAVWSPSITGQTNLFSIPVTPFYCRGNAGDYALTTSAFCMLPFMYWRGDMEYLVIIPVSSSHRGKLQFLWTSTVTTGVAYTNVLYNKIVDVSASIDHIFTIGFGRDIPACESSIITDTYPSVQRTNTFNGAFSVNVVNPLTALNDTATVNIFIFARAGDNMQFGVPKVMDVCDHGDGTNEIGDFSTAYCVQMSSGGALGDDAKVAPEKMEIFPSSGDYDAKAILWGENFNSVRPFLQKFSRMYNTPNIQNYSTTVLGHFPDLCSAGGAVSTTIPAGLNQRFFNWAGWYRCMFVDIACSTRYKVISTTGVSSVLPNMPSIALSITRLNMPAGFPPNPPNQLYMTSMSAMWMIGQGEAFEITVPYYNPLKWCFAYSQPNLSGTPLSDPSNPLDIVNMYLDTGTIDVLPTLAWYNACGPDIRISTFRFCPLVAHYPFVGGTVARWGH
jgi:hypothetical protein